MSGGGEGEGMRVEKERVWERRGYGRGIVEHIGATLVLSRRRNTQALGRLCRLACLSQWESSFSKLSLPGCQLACVGWLVCVADKDVALTFLYTGRKCILQDTPESGSLPRSRALS